MDGYWSMKTHFCFLEQLKASFCDKPLPGIPCNFGIARQKVTLHKFFEAKLYSLPDFNEWESENEFLVEIFVKISFWELCFLHNCIA